MIIGIIGEIGSGKTTAANVLKEKFNFEINPLALLLKDVVRLLFNFKFTQVFGSFEEKNEIDNRWGISPREALQILGTDIMREKIHDLLPNLKVNRGEFWIKRFKDDYLAHKKIMNDMGHEINVVIDDVRFKNEFEMIKELGGIVVKIVRPSIIKKSHHRSETEKNQITPDHIIFNNQSLDVFKHVVYCWYCDNFLNK